MHISSPPSGSSRVNVQKDKDDCPADNRLSDAGSEANAVIETGSACKCSGRNTDEKEDKKTSSDQDAEAASGSDPFSEVSLIMKTLGALKTRKQQRSSQSAGPATSAPETAAPETAAPASPSTPAGSPTPPTPATPATSEQPWPPMPSTADREEPSSPRKGRLLGNTYSSRVPSRVGDNIVDSMTVSGSSRVHIGHHIGGASF
ncbi:hypothetical protein B0I35DRAFT_480252 [Stachybotrys elegans]|uniref:Uncharacterized protein n=1 Tax=Stachybotrys elegans TaxID=80388 RepID=A0A8K0WP16_9HYPO|nr:hypothetical protein B0I35DRAFT_480252 [Stachybotrys elegans]